MQDILDGYFPSELKDEHPDGMIFEVSDKSGAMYSSPNLGTDGFSRVAASKSHPVSLAQVGQPHLNLGIKEFMSALPVSIIAGGSVVHVKEGIAKLLSATADAPIASSSTTIVSTPVGVSEDTPIATIQVRTSGTTHPTCHCHDILLRHQLLVLSPTHDDPFHVPLQVKSADGLQTLVVKLPYSSTVRDLMHQVSKHHAVDSTSYELRTAYPRRALEAMDATVEEAKLVPTAVVYMKGIAAAGSSSGGIAATGSDAS